MLFYLSSQIVQVENKIFNESKACMLIMSHTDIDLPDFIIIKTITIQTLAKLSVNLVATKYCNLRTSYTMVCPPVRGNNPRALVIII